MARPSAQDCIADHFAKDHKEPHPLVKVIASEMNRRNLSQVRMAKLANFSRAKLSNLLSGHGDPKLSSVDRLLAALGGNLEFDNGNIQIQAVFKSHEKWLREQDPEGPIPSMIVQNGPAIAAYYNDTSTTILSDVVEDTPYEKIRKYADTAFDVAEGGDIPKKYTVVYQHPYLVIELPKHVTAIVVMGQKSRFCLVTTTTIDSMQTKNQKNLILSFALPAARTILKKLEEVDHTIENDNATDFAITVMPGVVWNIDKHPRYLYAMIKGTLEAIEDTAKED